MHRNCLKVTTEDKLLYHDILAHYRKFEAEIGDNAPLRVLSQDFIACAFNPKNPELREEKQVFASSLPNRAIMQAFCGLTEFHTMKGQTIRDAQASARIFRAMLSELEKKLNEYRAGDTEKVEKDFSRFSGLLGTLQILGKDHVEIRAKRDKLALQLEDRRKTLFEKLQADKDQLREFCRDLLKFALAEKEKTDEFSYSFGAEPDLPVRLDYEQAQKLQDTCRNNSRLQQIAKLAGKLKSIALGKRETKAEKACEEITEIETGDSIPRMVPKEYLYLSLPCLNLDWCKRYVEKALVQYKLSGTEKKAQGPIIVCIDSSGSMTGQREIWANAVFLALQAIAQKQKRDIHYITFTTHICHQEKFAQGKVDPVKLAEMISFFRGHGGTRFDAPLQAAIELFQKDRKLDCIFITDGFSQISENVLQEIHRARKNGFHLYTVLICSRTDTLNEISDSVYCLNDMNQDAATHEIFEKV